MATEVPEPPARRPRASYDFRGRTIVVTGGAGDIGYSAAQLFARFGADVALLDVDEGRVRQRLDDLAEVHAGRVLAVACDVTSPSEVSRAFADVEREFGAVHHVFNNAGYQGAFSPVQTYPADDFQRVLDVNLIGVFHVLQAAVEPLRRTRGSVVNTASYAGVVGPPNMVAYAASKFGVIGLTQSAAKDLAPFGVRVNAISPALIGPGMMWTRQTELQARAGSRYFSPDPAIVERQMIESVPMQRLGTPDEVARGVAFLMSEDAAYITGFNLVLSGGQ
jgi:NAD(P)-dependent dehydrogenase (short-subunit alcohol dehydrogenase family)